VLKYSSLEHKISLSFSPGLIPMYFIFFVEETAFARSTILTEGIQNINLTDIFYAKSLGYKIKLLSISEIKNNKLMERVHPCLILENSYIAKIDGVLNAVVVDGLPIGKSILQGEGAGPGPTSSALISDLCSVLKGKISYPFGVSSFSRKNKSFCT